MCSSLETAAARFDMTLFASETVGTGPPTTVPPMSAQLVPLSTHFATRLPVVPMETLVPLSRCTVLAGLALSNVRVLSCARTDPLNASRAAMQSDLFSISFDSDSGTGKAARS